MLPVHIHNIHRDVSAQELIDALNNGLPTPVHIEGQHITFLPSRGHKSTILLLRDKSALRSITKSTLPVLHGQQIVILTSFQGLRVLSEATDPTIEYDARVHWSNTNWFC